MLNPAVEFSGKLSFVRDDLSGMYYYGVIVNGALLKLGGVKIGKVEKWQTLGADNAAQQTASTPTTPATTTA